MMGGGADLDAAFRWLCLKTNGGDFLVLRARGGDSYNAYVNGLCRLNSVATLIIPDRASAEEQSVADMIRDAEAVFIAGGDQGDYIDFWEGTPAEDAINAHVRAGKPIGGTSAGLAVLGQFAYGALRDKPEDNDLTSLEVLTDPYSERLTLVRDFLEIPLLKNLITDSHFAKRDRMGRSLGFLARIIQDGWSAHPNEVAIDEKSAVLIEPDGAAAVAGPGRGAYFIRPLRPPDVCKRNTPLTFRDISVQRWPTGSHFHLRTWEEDGGVSYELSVIGGKIDSTQADGSLY